MLGACAHRRRRGDPAHATGPNACGTSNRSQKGVALISATLPKGSVGPYQLQAAIAAVHDEAARAEDTDWPQILALYDLLSVCPTTRWSVESRDRSCDGPWRAKGLEMIEVLRADPRIAATIALTLFEPSAGARRRPRGGHQTLPAAAGKTGSLPERNYLLTQAARLSSEPRD